VTRALSILQGRFGRVALLDMDTSLVDHAHPHYHLIFKASGPDQKFVVEGQTVPLRGDTLVAVNSWQQHAYEHRRSAERTLFLALYIEPGWLADADRHFANCSEPGFFPQAGIAITSEIDRLRAGVVPRLKLSISIMWPGRPACPGRTSIICFAAVPASVPASMSTRCASKPRSAGCARTTTRSAVFRRTSASAPRAISPGFSSSTPARRPINTGA